MNKIENCKAARDYHTHGCNCAQSILAAFHEDMGFTEDQCMALAGGMGGGMRCGSICGAISGGILVLGMLFPATAAEGPAGKRRITQQTQEYIRRFRERFVDRDCADLLKRKDLMPTGQSRDLGVADHCGILIVSAVEILCYYIAELKGE